MSVYDVSPLSAKVHEELLRPHKKVLEKFLKWGREKPDARSYERIHIVKGIDASRMAGLWSAPVVLTKKESEGHWSPNSIILITEEAGDYFVAATVGAIVREERSWKTLWRKRPVAYFYPHETVGEAIERCEKKISYVFDFVWGILYVGF